MRRRGKTFLSLILSVVIVTGQPVLEADFSAGEETFISETTEQEGDVSEASAIFEDTADSDSEMRYEEYEATVSNEILDLGQTGVNGSGWKWERIEIKNTDPDPDMFMCLKRSIWIYNNGKKPVTVDFENTEHFWAYLDDYETGVIMAGEGTTVYLRPKKREQVVTDIFKISITGGRELSYTISQNCPHI